MTNFTDSQASERPVMSRSLLFLAILLATPPRVHAQLTVDTTGAGALIAQAMDHSEVMTNLRELSDVIGPRLSGSAAMRRANDWTAGRFRAYGLTTSLEAYTFGVTWERGSALPQADRAVHANDHGTELGVDRRNGRQGLTGPVVLADLTTPDSLAAYKGKVRGAWVLPRSAYPLWNPDGPPMTAADSATQAQTLRRAGRPRRTRARPPSSRAGSSRSTCRTCSRPPARWAPWWTGPRSTP